MEGYLREKAGTEWCGKRNKRWRRMWLNSKKEMQDYLENAMKTEKARWKQNLFFWGGTMDLCRRKQSEIKRFKDFIKENEKLATEVIAEVGIEKISERYKREIYKIEEEINVLLEKKGEMDIHIFRLSPEEQEFIYLRFEKGFGHDYISMKLHQSRANCFRMQNRILAKLAKSFCGDANREESGKICVQE